jgi:uncharacterized protein DUF1707/cell wall-active antibiotic response 4TMS protein YvqF
MHMTARDLRASDADRDRVITVLTDAAVDGRLTQEEFSERLSSACSAVTLGDLAKLTADLAATPVVHVDASRIITGVFGDARREGRWVVPESLTVTAVRGTVVVDFREALLRSSRVKVYAHAVAGRVHIYVPDGIRVEVTGRAFLGSRSVGRNYGAAALQAGPDTPVISVQALVLGGKLVIHTPPRRPGRLRRLFSRS